MKKYEFTAHYRYAGGDEKDYWHGTVETDDFSEEFRISVEKEIKNKDRRVFQIYWEIE